MFQIKRLNSACSVLYLHRKSNTIDMIKATESKPQYLTQGNIKIRS